MASRASNVSGESRTTIAFLGLEGRASPILEAPNIDNVEFIGRGISRDGGEDGDSDNGQSTIDSLFAPVCYSTCSAMYSANFSATFASAKSTPPRSVVPNVIAFLRILTNCRLILCISGSVIVRGGNFIVKCDSPTEITESPPNG